MEDNLRKQLKGHLTFDTTLAKSILQTHNRVSDLNTTIKSMFPKNPALFGASESLKSFQKMMEPLAEMSRRFEYALRPQIETLRTTQRAAELALGYTSYFKDLAPKLNSLTTFADSLNRSLPKDFWQRLAEAALRDERIDAIHLKDKTFIPPFFNEFAPAELYELFQDESKTSIEVYHAYFLRKENADALVLAWAKSDYLSERIRPLRSAVEAHVEGKFELSIPTLMREFEGLLVEMLAVTQGKIKSRIKQVLNKKDGEYRVNIFPHQVLADIICDEVFNSSDEKQNKSSGVYPNRHLIQHGSDKNYFENEQYSTRLMMLIDALRSDKLREAIRNYRPTEKKKKTKKIRAG